MTTEYIAVRGMNDFDIQVLDFLKNIGMLDVYYGESKDIATVKRNASKEYMHVTVIRIKGLNKWHKMTIKFLTDACLINGYDLRDESTIIQRVEE